MIRNILIVDDSAVQRRYLAGLLRGTFAIYEAENATRALEMVREGNIDLVIIDAYQRESDGYTFTEQLRKDSSFSHIPVIMHSARDRPCDVRAGFEAGVNAYIYKPAAKEILLELIHDLETDGKLCRKIKALVVDDSVMIRSILRRAFEANGVEVLEAENGARAFELAISEKPELITMDIEMPVMDGFTATRKIRDFLAGTPVFMITAGLSQELKERAFEAGVTAYLTKPFEPVATVKSILEKLDKREESSREASILVVEDSVTERHIIRYTLETAGYSVTDATDGMSALKLLSESDRAGKQFELLVVDYCMPNMDGLTLIRRIKENESLADLPVILLTTSGQKGIASAAFNAGADDFMSKPFDADEFLARIAFLLRKKNEKRK